MNAVIQPAPLTGEISAVASKSDAHRLLILAALSKGKTHVCMEQRSADIDATLECLAALGAQVSEEPGGVSVIGIGRACENPLLDCKESGSTLRFLLPVAAAVCEKAQFVGRGRLPERPIGELIRAMEAHGVTFTAERLPLSISGKLMGGTYSLPGNISSQYLTGLLLALPLLSESSRIQLTTRLESAAYVEITLHALRRFGVQVSKKQDAFEISGRQKFRSPGQITVEGDWSNAAFFLAAGALGAPVRVAGLSLTSLQGDRAILDALMAFGAAVEATGDAIRVTPAPLNGCEIDVADTPDLLPVLAVLGACARGETRLVNAARLRLKESDRLASVSDMLRALGGDVLELPDALVIRGGVLHGGAVDSRNDHRIVMAAAVASVCCSGEVTIFGADAVQKSYPAFFSDFNRLGGKASVV
ncbi:MAG: 3-phosphoshikimate 1-carboxyvinyltransferase [Eubacteriales bacterium]|nr:3-phosphoshikimate 1-carboxyvinyltransferase [Eubacteriales bacterium]